MADSSLAPIDLKMATLPILSVYGIKIDFQFPPKITGETNAWVVGEQENLLSYGPLKVLAGMAGRTINVEWEYIATDNKFSGKIITGHLRNLKQYYFAFRAKGSKQNAIHPVVQFKYGAVVPDLVNFRMMNLTITYGPELVVQGGDLFPLYSKAAIVLELASTLGPPDKLLVPDLRRVEPAWY